MTENGETTIELLRWTDWGAAKSNLRSGYLWIGKSPRNGNGSGEYFSGIIDNVFIYDRILNKAEIQAISEIGIKKISDNLNGTNVAKENFIVDEKQIEKTMILQSDSIEIKKRHKRFIEKVCESEIVWALESEEYGYAKTDFTNKIFDGGFKPTGVCFFWSERALAQSFATGSWDNYIPVEIPLIDFIELHCDGLYFELYMVGTNFDQNMVGFEIDPMVLITELETELKNQGKRIE